MLEAALAAGGVRPRKVDKKVEKAAVAVEKQALLAKLRTPGIQGPDLLALVIPYLVAKLHGKLVRAALKAKNRFVDGMLSAHFRLLHKCMRAVRVGLGRPLLCLHANV